MGIALTRFATSAVIACAIGIGSLAPAFAGSAGAADSRGPQLPNDGGGAGPRHGGGPQQHGDRARNGGGGWQGGGQREGDWHRHDGDWHRHDGGPGWAPFLFGGLAAGAAPYYAPPDDGDPCYQLRPTYDQWNNYVGRQWVNVCE